MTADIIQGSPEWHQARLGCVTASRIADVCARTKTGFGASRANYMAELIVERLTGQREEKFTNAAMQHGTETEPEARAAYEFRQNVDVVQVGFVKHWSIADTGASPDGLVGDDGLVEIKCPNTATHLETLLTGEIPQKYVLQMHWQMICTGRKWCDFVSYDPRLPEAMRMSVQRVELDQILADVITKDVVQFLSELRAKEDELLRKYGEEPEMPEGATFMMAG